PLGELSLGFKDNQNPAFIIRPYAPDGQLAGLSFSGNYNNFFGLGADFRQIGDDLNLKGEMVLPGGPFGNRRITSFGFKPNQIQMPILYALGPGNECGAIFVDETRPLMWNLKNEPWTSAVAGPLGPDLSFRFFVILGPNMDSLRRSYMNIVGHPPVPPAGTFGVWARNDGENGDIDWAHHISSLKNNVPGLVGLSIKNLNEQSEIFKTAAKAHNLDFMLDESAYIPVQSPHFTEMARRSFLVRQNNADGPPIEISDLGEKSGLIDYTNTLAHTFWHSLYREAHLNDGINFFRLIDGDLYDFNTLAYYEGSLEAGLHSHYAWANRYILSWLDGISTGVTNQQRRRNSPRLLLLSRTATAGLARFGGALYNGESFLFSTRLLTSVKAHVALSGIDYYSSDISSVIKSRPPDNSNANIYDVWLAKSALLDLPLVLPEILLNTPNAKYNLEVRESLFPYYYSLAFRAYLNGDPVLAPLTYYFQDDVLARNRIHELMLGPSIL
ncbi:MAG: TIM-barrel domain-containing protein, partial [Candidatus Adiutrix sp.]